jgi:hypothetical protein
MHQQPHHLSELYQHRHLLLCGCVGTWVMQSESRVRCTTRAARKRLRGCGLPIAAATFAQVHKLISLSENGSQQPKSIRRRCERKA